jgi:hypothetical protein
MNLKPKKLACSWSKRGGGDHVSSAKRLLECGRGVLEIQQLLHQESNCDKWVVHTMPAIQKWPNQSAVQTTPFLSTVAESKLLYHGFVQ